jgi:uncharacterized protein (DUF2235 family)
MSKNIVICSDGTGNTSIKGRGTNVFKLYEAVDLNGHRWDTSLRPQLAFYDDGVGSEDFKPLRILGGVAGYGLSQNVRQLYKELARVYDPGDNIYMFGFSRGAFTVRSLVGLIATCGLIHPQHAPTKEQFDSLVDNAYAAYRACYRTALNKLVRGPSNRNRGEEFRQRYGRDERTPIRFVGVWDTVDAVGLPFHLSDIINSTVYRFKFPDPFLSDSVIQACHALSIDDDRHSFQPLVWDESVHGDRIEQVWFAGVHSNVGGGYPKQGMSLVALDWMLEKAEGAGLRFNDRDREAYRALSSVDDKLYDPRAGLGTFYRWKLRDIAGICERNHIKPIRIHVSALERAAHGTDDYAPVNLPRHVVVTSTPPERHRDPSLVRQRAYNVEEAVNCALNGRRLLDQLKGTILVGRLSYYVFLISCTAAAIAAVAVTAPNPTLSGFVESMASLAGGFVSSPIAATMTVVRGLFAHPVLIASIALAVLLSCIMARFADKRISRFSSEFWYRHQSDLRQALKDARLDAGARSAA